MTHTEHTTRSCRPGQDGPPRWGVIDVARYLGVASVTVRAYASRGQMPPPDGRIGQTPWWWSPVIKTWAAGRRHARSNARESNLEGSPGV